MPLNEEQKKDIRFILEDCLDVLFPRDEKERKERTTQQTKRLLLDLIAYVILRKRAQGKTADYLEDQQKFTARFAKDVLQARVDLEKLLKAFISEIASPLQAIVKEEKWDLAQCLARRQEVTLVGNLLCFPQQYLHGLEKKNSHITVYDVQVSILAEIRERIAKFFPKLMPVLDASAMENSLRRSNAQFESEKSATSSWEDPFQIKNTEEKIFSGNFIFKTEEDYSFEGDFIKVYLRIEVKLVQQLVENTKLFSRIVAPVFRVDAQELEYLKKQAAELQAEAREECQRYAAHEVLFKSQLSLAVNNERLKVRVYALITTTYYYRLLMDNKLKWEELIKIAEKPKDANEDYADERVKLLCHADTINFLTSNPLNIDLRKLLLWTNSEIRNICHPAIYSLISNKRIDLKKAKKLPANVLLLTSNPTFFHLLSQRKLKLKDLKSVPTEQYAMVTLPSITRMISLGIITLAFAKTIPLHLAPAIKHSAYSDYFKKNSDWESFFKLEWHHVELMIFPGFAELLCQHAISLAQLRRLPAPLTRLLMRNPYVLKEFHATKNYADNLLQRDISQLNCIYAAGYFVRIFALAIHSPYPVDDRHNAKQLLLDELPSAAADCNVTVMDFHNDICYFFAKYLKSDLKNRMKETSNVFLQGIFAKILAVFPNKTVKTDNWREVIQSLIVIVNSIQEKFASMDANSSRNEQTPKAQDVTSLKDFCSIILDINPFIQYKQEPTEMVRNRVGFGP